MKSWKSLEILAQKAPWNSATNSIRYSNISTDIAESIKRTVMKHQSWNCNILITLFEDTFRECSSVSLDSRIFFSYLYFIAHLTDGLQTRYLYLNTIQTYVQPITVTLYLLTLRYTNYKVVNIAVNISVVRRTLIINSVLKRFNLILLEPCKR